MMRNVLVAVVAGSLLLALGCQPPAGEKKPVEAKKPAEKVAAKPAPKAVEKVIEKPAAKPAEKVAEAPPAKPVEKPAAAAKMGSIPGVPQGKVVADKKVTTVVEAAVAPIKVDGKLDDAAGMDAVEFDSFVDSAGKPVAVQSRLLVSYDKDNLYLAVVNEEPDTAKLKVAVTQRGGNVWSDDSDEIYVDPSHKKSPEFIGLFVNSKNVQYDRTRAGPQKWEGGKWESATGVIDGKAWIVEVAVSWKAMGVTPIAGHKLGVMVGRNRFSGAERGSASYLAPCGKEAKNTQVYPVLQLK